MTSSPHARLIAHNASGALVAALALGCGEGTSPPVPASVTVSPEIVIIDSIGGTVQFMADVRDERGAAISGASVTWSVSDLVIATIDANIGLATAVALGGTTVTARAAAVSDDAALEVFVPSDTVFLAGETYFGRRQYIEYQAGDLPIIVSAPHGGILEPAEISARTFGVTTRDLNTQELARAFASALFDRTGRRAHIIINRRHRNRLDANREIVGAAQGDIFGEWAWAEYHGFIEAAKQSVDEQYGSGLYIDLHGHRWWMDFRGLVGPAAHRVRKLPRRFQRDHRSVVAGQHQVSRRVRSQATPRSVVEGRAGPRRACHWQSVGVTHPVRRPSRQVYRSAPAPMRAANVYAGLTVERGHGHKLQRLSAAAADAGGRVRCG